MDKKRARLRRSRRPRAKMKELEMARLSIFRTARHIYAQVIAPDGAHTVAAASTLEADLKKEMTYGGNIAAAQAVGRLIAERASAAGVERVAFDRSGFRYHGRVKALADKAREHGLKL